MEKLIEVTDQDLIEALEKAVQEKGKDYVYTPKNVKCLYAEYNEGGVPIAPSCLIGHAAVNMGLPVSRLVEMETEQARVCLPKQFSGLSDAALYNANTAQEFQDQGMTWGEALENFKHELKSAKQSID